MKEISSRVWCSANSPSEVNPEDPDIKIAVEIAVDDNGQTVYINSYTDLKHEVGIFFATPTSVYDEMSSQNISAALIDASENFECLADAMDSRYIDIYTSAYQINMNEIREYIGEN